jgi:molybdopterin synthase sulfur carrier subunit
MSDITTAGDVAVLIPAPLRRFTNGAPKVTVAGSSISELVDNLEAAYPGIKDKICEPDGRIRRFVNVFVNGANIRGGDGPQTALKPGDEVGIVPAMAGGWR